MKPIIASLLVAATMTAAVATATPAAALAIHVGPHGVGVRLGHPRHVYRHRYHRGFVVHRHFYHHGYRRF